jgi:hypothetical protein
MVQAEWLITTCVVARLQFKAQLAGRQVVEQEFFKSQFTQEEVVTPSDHIGT